MAAVPLKMIIYNFYLIAAAPYLKKDHVFGMYGGRLLGNGQFFLLLKNGRSSNKGKDIPFNLSAALLK
jgi:hypothetical protein